MSGITYKLLATLPDAPVIDIRIGAFWTAVVIEIEGRRRCGLASTVRGFDHHHYGSGPAVPEAGRLLDRSALDLAQLSQSPSLMESSLGIATINALLPSYEARWVDLNAEHVIAKYGADKRVALIGHFPFIPRLREQVGTLWVLEQDPRGEDLPAEAAEEILPQADLLAITGTTLINHTFDHLMALHRPEALVLVLGPSTPLSPILFDHGVQLLSGAVVEDIDSVLRAASQGANFRQLHRQGVRLVTMQATAGQFGL
jgi:hypothetical protein